MHYLLFPGRHILNTSFQERYLWEILRLPLNKLDFLSGKTNENDTIGEIIFVVTSANQANSRYNPVPFYLRAIGLDRFAAQYKKSLGVTYRIIGIPHFNPTDTFAELVLKEVEEATSGKVILTPKNCVVLSSTPEVFRKFQQLGFHILPAEYDGSTDSYKALTPIDVVKHIVEAGEDDWHTSAIIGENLSKASRELWLDFPNIPDKLFWLWKDPLLTEEGSITTTRNYSTYAWGMSHDTLIEVKYRDIRSAIQPGKIVDEGCADCALIAKIAKDFPDSDIIGIEITGEFIARCLERQRAGEFGSSFVHIHQRNLQEDIFDENSIDTTICNSTTHELWSYLEQEKTLLNYLKIKYKQLKNGGRLIIRDVVGPENKDMPVYMWLKRDDGENGMLNTDEERTLESLEKLSTYARFKVFAEDFLKDMRESGKRGAHTAIKYQEERVHGEHYVVTSLKNAAEFMSKKDYIDNWKSELNEEFTFWDFNEWKQTLENEGFTILENPNDLSCSSRAYTNEWIVEHRYMDKVKLFTKDENGALVELAYPHTNIVLIGEKPGGSE